MTYFTTANCIIITIEKCVFHQKNACAPPQSVARTTIASPTLLVKERSVMFPEGAALRTVNFKLEELQEGQKASEAGVMDQH